MSKKNKDCYSLPPPFVRIGNKKCLRHMVLDNLPADYKTYVEPFVGSGVIYLHSKPAVHSVINDLDVQVVSVFQFLQEGLNADMFLPIWSKEGVDIHSSRASYEKTVSMIRERYCELVEINNCREHEFQKLILEMNGTFSCKKFSGVNSLYRCPARLKINPTQELLDKYNERLNNNTDILCQDAFEVMCKYDSPDTFMFLDPPYEFSKKNDLYKFNDNSVVFKILNFMVSCQSKVMLTYNDCDIVRDFCSDNGLLVKEFLIKGGNQKKAIGSKNRIELFVFNYDP